MTGVDAQDVELRDGTRIQLRTARPEDASAIVEFLHLAVGETDFSDFSVGELMLTESTAQAYIRQGVDGDNRLFLLAVTDGRAIGMLTFSGGKWSRNRYAGELSMTVLRRDWGMGLGGAMVDPLLRWVRAGGVVNKIQLRVRADNGRAISLYQKKGLEREGVTRGDMIVDGRVFDHWLMGKLLSSAP